MTNTITTNKRGRNSSVILTDRMCERRVAKQIKFLQPANAAASVEHHQRRRGDLLFQVYRPRDRQAAHWLDRRL